MLEAYDPSTDTWTRLADIPIPLGHLMASVVVADGKLITIGGVTNDDNPAGQDGTRRTATVFGYDPATDEWLTLESLPDERQSPAVGLVNGQVVVASGASSLGREFSTFVADASQLFATAGSSLVVSESTLEFGSVTVGTTAEQQLTLTNTGLAGGEPITIDPSAASLTPDDGAFTLAFATTTPIVLAPGASTTATVTYQPTAAASDTAVLSIPHDGLNASLEVSLSGTGVAAGGGGVVYRVNAGGAVVAGSPAWAVDTDASPSSFSNFDPIASTSKASTVAAS
ncbi:MAG: choice-of-anchor D domain-containing protein, partial [Pseudomonadota bacterium]